MTREEQLEAALVWALENGVNWGEGAGKFYDMGCGCCSSDIAPPEALKLVLEEAARKLRP
jgi:hypothetical protein